MSDQIQAELLTIKGDKELLLGEDVVEWAKTHPDSKLHGQFEWNNREAGHQYRLWQARRLIAIHVVYPDNGQRQLISLSVDRGRPGGGYRHYDDIKQDRQLGEIMLQDALADLKRIEARYDFIKTDLESVWKAVDKIRRKVARRKGGDRPRATA